MRFKTPNRLLALALLSAAVPFHAQSGYGAPADNNSPDQRPNRQRYSRPQSDTNAIPALAPTRTAPVPAPTATPIPDLTATPGPDLTATPAPVPPDAPQQTSQPYAAPPSTPARRATISYTDGRLAIVASNSSLNQILRDVSRTANITITGGVAEERVFGNYGPGTPLEVLSALLDGTGTNMLLIACSDGRASELVLSARNGGPTPPNPGADGLESRDENEASTPPDIPPSQREADAPPEAAITPPPASGDPSQQSPNGTKTPQQIYDDLIKMRQSQEQAQPQQQPQ